MAVRKVETPCSAMDSKKSNKIADIVKLQRMLKKWRRLADSSKNDNAQDDKAGNKSIKFLKRTLSFNNISASGSGASSDTVPKGCLAVCVGEELKKFVIPTEYLSHQAFQVLLRDAEEEFGFQQEGVLRIPCEVDVFETILKVMRKKEHKLITQEFIFSREDGSGCCSSDSQLSQPHHPQSPMCR
uniref:SAUR family protein n=1 Tax=Kalanchoe fedtschenkoi TaxID=63787 RepID=A0A7N0URP2_KALFE